MQTFPTSNFARSFSREEIRPGGGSLSPSFKVDRNAPRAKRRELVPLAVRLYTMRFLKCHMTLVADNRAGYPLSCSLIMYPHQDPHSPPLILLYHLSPYHAQYTSLISHSRAIRQDQGARLPYRKTRQMAPNR